MLVQLCYTITYTWAQNRFCVLSSIRKVIPEYSNIASNCNIFPINRSSEECFFSTSSFVFARYVHTCQYEHVRRESIFPQSVHSRTVGQIIKKTECALVQPNTKRKHCKIERNTNDEKFFSTYRATANKQSTEEIYILRKCTVYKTGWREVYSIPPSQLRRTLLPCLSFEKSVY